LGARISRTGSSTATELTGGGADAVRDIVSPAADTSTSVGVIGTLLALVAVLSFTRAVQRLFEQTWELAPLSVRNTLNGLRWGLALAAFRDRERLDPRCRRPRAP
jgi:membrane protein